MFCVVVGYVFLCGIWSIADDCLCGRETRTPICYGNLVAAVLMIAFGIISIIYSRYLVHVAPLYLGGLMLAHGFVCFVAALCTKVRMQWILTLLSLFVLLGGCSIVIFTFGFKIVLTLAQVSGITLLLSCAYELVTHLNYRRSSNGDMEREKKTPNGY